MAKRNVLAKEFFKLLKRSKFPASAVDIEDVLNQHYAIITELNNRVIALLGTGSKLDTMTLAQGIKGGGGGPHRLDLVLDFGIHAPESTLMNARKLHEEVF